MRDLKNGSHETGEVPQPASDCSKDFPEDALVVAESPLPYLSDGLEHTSAIDWHYGLYESERRMRNFFCLLRVYIFLPDRTMAAFVTLDCEWSLYPSSGARVDPLCQQTKQQQNVEALRLMFRVHHSIDQICTRHWQGLTFFFDSSIFCSSYDIANA